MLIKPAPADTATGREIDEKQRIFSFEAINGWRGIGSIGIAVAHLPSARKPFPWLAEALNLLELLDWALHCEQTAGRSARDWHKYLRFNAFL
jgi:hypothetical protein